MGLYNYLLKTGFLRQNGLATKKDIYKHVHICICVYIFMASERTGIYANLHAQIHSAISLMPAQVCSLQMMSLPCDWEMVSVCV